MRSGLAWARLGVSFGLAAPLLASASDNDWFHRTVLNRIKLSGSRDLALHFEKVTGDTEAYSQNNYGGLGGQTFTDLGYLHIEGKKVANLFNLDMTFQDSRFADPQDEKLTMSYDEGDWQAAVGDV
ncbi:MAG: hypothetical protein ABUL72_01545, partial [Armatimonadota bacterium]